MSSSNTVHRFSAFFDESRVLDSGTRSDDNFIMLNCLNKSMPLGVRVIQCLPDYQCSPQAEWKEIREPLANDE
jgi:hypothetical protein